MLGVNPLPIKSDFDARLDLLCENINKDYVNWSNGKAIGRPQGYDKD